MKLPGTARFVSIVKGHMWRHCTKIYADGNVDKKNKWQKCNAFINIERKLTIPINKSW